MTRACRYAKLRDVCPSCGRRERLRFRTADGLDATLLMKDCLPCCRTWLVSQLPHGRSVRVMTRALPPRYRRLTIGGFTRAGRR